MDSGRLNKKLRSQKFLQAQRRWKELRAHFAPLEASNDMKYQRVLGFGGFGIVQLWHVLKDDGKLDRAVALKTLIWPYRAPDVWAIRREIQWHKLFMGSEHFVQLVNLDKKVVDTLDINSEAGTGDPVMVMEELGRGSLAQLLERVEFMKQINSNSPGKHNGVEYIPNCVLWSIFLCLARACIGMAYPPREPEKNTGLNVRETIRPDETERKVLHSDIDPSNIFISDPDADDYDNEHGFAPITKVADYGCMVEWDDKWSDNTKRRFIWGKPAYMAPEQIDLTRCVQKNAIGSHTNVYQIGATMHELIHQSYMSINQRSRQDRSIIGGVTVSTYGWRLLEDDDWKLEDNVRNVDVELRELVAGCMAHSVAHRPPLGILEELITSQLNQAVKAVLGAEAAAAQGLNPVASSFVPGGQPAAADPDVVRYHQKRVPQGQTEPSPLLARFYQIYFYDAWGETDDFKDYWSKPPPQSGQVPNPP